MRHNSIYMRYTAAILCALLLWSCGGAKLAVADEQMERGEYYDASRTYRGVYNKLKKREERPLRGEVAYKMGLCYRKLNMSARASAAFQNALRYSYPDSLTHLYPRTVATVGGALPRRHQRLSGLSGHRAAGRRRCRDRHSRMPQRDGSESLPHPICGEAGQTLQLTPCRLLTDVCRR